MRETGDERDADGTRGVPGWPVGRVGDCRTIGGGRVGDRVGDRRPGGRVGDRRTIGGAPRVRDER